MEMPTKGNSIVRSTLTGFGTTILFLLSGTILDYFVTQALSQFLLVDCSEDCYFRYFNLIFLIVVLTSIAMGIRSGVRKYRRFLEKS
jgi:hypothetical protein